MTRKTCFCHLIFKQTTPKDTQYNFMPDNTSRLKCTTCPMQCFCLQSPKRDRYSNWTPQDENALMGPICTIKSCQLNHRLERHKRLKPMTELLSVIFALDDVDRNIFSFSNKSLLTDLSCPPWQIRTMNMF